MAKAVGIDLGTTNSEVAVLENGIPRVLPNEQGDFILPSCVGLTEDGQLLVGREALNQYAAAPQRTVRSIKRYMGTDHLTTFEYGQEKRTYAPQEISAIVLRELKHRAEAALGAEVTQSVITVPAYFTDTQRQATKEAGEIAGLEVLQIINEPTAAALTYELNTEETEHILVYDLGGGTFDVSIVEMTGDVREVMASHGNNRLGGDDFDLRLKQHFMQVFQETQKTEIPEDPLIQARLIRAAETAKIELSEHAFVKVREPFLVSKGKKALHLDTEVSRATFEDLIRPLLAETLEAIDKALEDAKLSAEDLDRVILVGGSTRIPLIHKMVSEHLGMVPEDSVEPDLCVALGAAIQAGVLSGEAVDSILVDITPHSLGIASVMDTSLGLMPDVFSVIIPRNTVIPTTRSQVYKTMFDNQEQVLVQVYQGENMLAKENVPLGEFRIENLPPRSAGQLDIEVSFDFDINGILTVTATEKGEGNQQRYEVSNVDSERLSVKDLKQAQSEIQELFEKRAMLNEVLDLEAEELEEGEEEEEADG